MAEASYIRRKTVRVTKYRDKKTGRFIRSRSKVTGKLLKLPARARQESYFYKQTTYGQWALGLRIPDQEIITKKIGQTVIDDWKGMIRDGLETTNLMAELPTAQFVDVTISGQTSTKHRYTLRQSLRVGDIKKKRAIIKLLMAKILGQLEGAGFRLDYPLELVKWRDAMKTRRETSALRVLKDVTITARVRR